MLLGKNTIYNLYCVKICIISRPSSAEGTGQKGTCQCDETFCNLLNLTQLRTWKCQIFDLTPPSGQKICHLQSMFLIIRDLFGLKTAKNYLKFHKITYEGHSR